MLVNFSNYFLVLSENVLVPGTALDALFWGFIAYSTQPIAAFCGAKFDINTNPNLLKIIPIINPEIVRARAS